MKTTPKYIRVNGRVYIKAALEDQPTGKERVKFKGAIYVKASLPAGTEDENNVWGVAVDKASRLVEVGKLSPGES